MKKQDKEPFLDRVLLHSKNADERLFDMILRFITFVILIIIIWIYADLTHAKADELYLIDSLLGDNEYNLKWYLNDSDWAMLDDEFNDIPEFTGNYNFTSEIPGRLVITSDMDLVNNYFIIGRNYWGSPNDSGSIIQIPRDVAINNHVMLIGETAIYSDSEIQCTNIWFDKRDSLNTTKYVLHNITIPSGTHAINTIVDYGTEVYAYFSNCPMLKGSSIDIQSYIQNGNTQNCFNCNYMTYDNLLVNQGELEEVESNLNHLYFEDVQIGLTGQASNQDITSAEVVVGVSVDDWVLNHINDFYVNIAYNVHMKDSLTGTPDPDFTIHKIVPLKAFMNDGYVYSIYDLFQEGNFISYYNNIRSTYSASVVSNDGWINSNAIVPTLLRNASYVFTDYFVRTVESQSSNYSIFDFGLDVTVQLSAGALGGTGNMSYPYTKAFDFLNGSSSITSAEGLRNHNPWLGETTTQANPLVPQGNNDIIGGGSYGGGNTSVNVNVSGQKIPMNVQTQQEINNTLTSYTNAFTTFSNSIRSLADAESQNNFYAVLSNTVPMIPGINIYLQYVALTCGVMLILLVLKILLF